MTVGSWSHAWGLVRRHPAAFFASLAFFFLFYALGLAPGLLTRALFDTLSGRVGAGFNIWTLVALVAAVEIARFCALYFGTVIYNFFYYSSEGVLKRNMLQWLVLAPGSKVLPGSTSEAISRFRDDPWETVVFASFLIPVSQVLIGMVALAIMLSINAAVSSVVLAPLVASVIVPYLFTRTIDRYRRAARETTARITDFIGQTFGAVQAVKLAGAAPHLLAHLADLNRERRGASIRDLMFTQGLGAFNANVATLAVGAVLLLAAHAMRGGTFTVGDFALFASYLSLATTCPVIVGQLLAYERQSRVSIARMSAVTAGAPVLSLVGAPRAASRDAPPATAHGGSLRSLEVRGLSRRHPGSDRGVQDIDLSLVRGGFVVVTGPVGSGKTTLLRTLLGLVARDTGQIRWNGEPVEDPASFMVPPRCAYTAQTPRLFSESLGENLLMGREAEADVLTAALELAVFDEDVARLPEGLATAVGTRGVTLSGGQLQRAATARMLLCNADLLVFDDLSSALDVETEHLLWQRLLASGSRSCLAVSHRREALRRADEVLVLDEGRVALRGEAQHLLRSSAVFRRIWG
jgi:ABC-type multidrug transport system fused ATPase/permease subunit